MEDLKLAEGLTRAFVAVPCGEPLRAALSRRLDASAAAATPCWTTPGTWHLTLQFLGDWPAARLDGLQARLSAIPPPPELVLTPQGWGGFPDLRRPRVLFLQFSGAEPLAELARLVRQASAEAWPEGPQDTRPTHPHLTLARVREPLESGTLKFIQDIRLDDLPALPVDRFCLLSSTRHQAGARHAERASFALRKKGE